MSVRSTVYLGSLVFRPLFVFAHSKQMLYKEFLLHMCTVVPFIQKWPCILLSLL